MDDWNLPWEGGCRCGETRFEVTRAPLIAMACHCAGCQRMTASAFALSLVLPVEGFGVTRGQPVLGGMRREPRHFHCPSCKSWMFTRPSALPGLVNLRAAMLDDHAWFRPFVEVNRAEGFAWAATGAPHSFQTGPADSAFSPLVAEYATWAQRPRRA